MDRKVWMATRAYGAWVPAPAINLDASPSGWSATSNFLNGGANVRNSTGSHRTFNLSWNLASQEELMPILNFAQGMYGDGLVYYSDPFAQRFNVMPRDWATPYVGGADGVILTGTVRPTLTNSGLTAQGFPFQQAAYNNVVTANSRQVWIPIPPGYKLVIAAYGSGTGNASWRVLPDGGSETVLPWRADLTGAMSTFSGVTGASIYLGGSGTNSATTAGIMAFVVPVAETVPVTQFNAGLGTSGMRFEGLPSMSQYSAVMNKVGMNARMVEVGAWL